MFMVVNFLNLLTSYNCRLYWQVKKFSFTRKPEALVFVPLIK